MPERKDKHPLAFLQQTDVLLRRLILSEILGPPLAHQRREWSRTLPRVRPPGELPPVIPQQKSAK